MQSDLCLSCSRMFHEHDAAQTALVQKRLNKTSWPSEKSTNHRNKITKYSDQPVIYPPYLFF